MAQMLALTNGDKTFDRGDNPAQSSDVQAAATLYGISNLLNIGEGFPQAIQRYTSRRRSLKRCWYTVALSRLAGSDH